MGIISVPVVNMKARGSHADKDSVQSNAASVILAIIGQNTLLLT